MAAHTAETKYNTEFAGNTAVISCKVDGGTQTGTIQFTQLTTIRGVFCQLAEAPSADAAIIRATIEGNIVTVREYSTTAVLNTQTALDYYLTVVGEY